ncbi:MAG: helix-turn-helix domain-containing protein [Candidatus Roizmanbacteria bacterium]|nr:helix-turn-helix domain-containing protein [Candidatus Roizmanbacteria bacterium]
MKPLSEVLQQQREARGITREELHKQTNISLHQIEAIEEGRWEVFPSFGYLSSIIRRYARAVGMVEERALSLLRRDCGDKKNQFIRTSGYMRRTLTSFPIAVIGVIAVILLFAYIELRTIFAKPRLDLRPTPARITRSEPLVIKGSTDRGVLLYLNKERIYQNEKGVFTQELYLRLGRQELEFLAIGENGQETRRTITVDVRL